MKRPIKGLFKQLNYKSHNEYMQDKRTFKSTIKKLISKIFDLRAFQILPCDNSYTPKRDFGSSGFRFVFGFS